MRRARRARSRLGPTVLALALATASGCSWVFTKPLPDNWQNWESFDCSTTPVPPLIDSLLALSNAGTTVYVAAFANGSGKALPIAAGVVATTLWLSSAIYGFSKTNACRDALGENTHGYHPPAYGTGGEVFGPLPPPPPPASGPAPGDDQEEPGRRRPPPPAPKADAPRFGG